MPLEEYGRSLCKVCNSRYRSLIDQMLSDPKQSIVSLVAYCEKEFGEKFTRRSMTTHRAKHLGEASILPNQVLFANARVQESINEKYDLGEVDTHDKAKVLNYVISKALAYMRQLESVHPTQISHAHIQSYIREIRECLKALEVHGEVDNSVNVQIVNLEVVSVLRTVSEIIREIMPEKVPEFANKLKSKMQQSSVTVLDRENPTKYLSSGDDPVQEAEFTDDFEE